jgi:hypothetical protein
MLLKGERMCTTLFPARGIDLTPTRKRHIPHSDRQHKRSLRSAAMGSMGAQAIMLSLLLVASGAVGAAAKGASVTLRARFPATSYMLEAVELLVSAPGATADVAEKNPDRRRHRQRLFPCLHCSEPLPVRPSQQLRPADRRVYGLLPAG